MTKRRPDTGSRPRNGASSPPNRFAHPAEQTFAQLLDYYGVEWQYEPRSFALAWDEAGNVTEAFTPDFYLPQSDQFIELTTLRPKLITLKNRKLRRLKELYPEINIKLLRRQELRGLMIKYGLAEQAARLTGTEAQPEAG
ncbi:MAG: hypothetical protein ACRDHL_07855 [Candidatus Promineifilaceae bacterium]